MRFTSARRRVICASSARHLRAICASSARQQFQRPPQKPRLCDNIPGTASILIDKNQGLRTFPVMWACFAHDDSKTQTALASAISGPPFGPFLEQCSSMFAQISCHFVLCLAGCFQNSNSPSICDFRPSFWTLFGAMFFNVCSNFLSSCFISCRMLPTLKQP